MRLAVILQLRVIVDGGRVGARVPEPELDRGAVDPGAAQQGRVSMAEVIEADTPGVGGGPEFRAARRALPLIARLGRRGRRVK